MSADLVFFRPRAADELDLVDYARCECLCARAELCVECRCCSACCRCIGGPIPVQAVQLTLVERGAGDEQPRTVDQVEQLIRAAQAAAFESRVELWAARALRNLRRKP